MTDATIHLACAADERYLPWCATMLHSALANGAARLAVHFLHPVDMPAPALARLGALVEGGGGSFHPTAVTSAVIESLPGTWYFPKIIWYRSLLPQLRPDLDRILYLDCDTLVLDALGPLWKTDLDGLYVAAVRNLIEPKLATRHHALGIPPEQTYFNSGVLLMNLEAMRRDGCVERLFEHARRHYGQSLWPDQDSLNYVLGPRCVFLDPRWNCQNSFFYWPQAEEVFGKSVMTKATTSPGILHFEGPYEAKPWHYLNRHPFREQFWQHLRETPYRKMRSEGRTLKNVLRRYLPERLYQGLRDLRRALRQLF
jgi:lipopolysaccharide biosynthesis glycosyltransferase